MMQLLSRATIWPQLIELKMPRNYAPSMMGDDKSVEIMLKSRQQLVSLSIDINYICYTSRCVTIVLFNCYVTRCIRVLVKSITTLDLSAPFDWYSQLVDVDVLTLLSIVNLSFLAITCNDLTDKSLKYISVCLDFNQ